MINNFPKSKMAAKSVWKSNGIFRLNAVLRVIYNILLNFWNLEYWNIEIWNMEINFVFLKKKTNKNLNLKSYE